MTQAFNLSQLANNVNTTGQLNAAAGLYNQLPVANGGTGAATLTANAVLIGNGTSAVTAVAASTTGNVLTSNGTTWVSQAASGGAPIVTIYSAPATWTKSPTLKAVKVTLVSGGGSGGVAITSAGSRFASGGGGGAGGNGYFTAPSIPGPVSVSVGSGGAGQATGQTPGNAGGTSSFGALISATGGGAGTFTPTSGQPGGSGGAITTSPTVIGTPGLPGSATSNSSSPGGNAWLNWGVGGIFIGYGAGSNAGISGTPTSSSAGKNGFVIVEEFY